MSNIFGDSPTAGGGDPSVDPAQTEAADIVSEAASAVFDDPQSATPTTDPVEADSVAAEVDGVDLTSIAEFLSDSGIDSVWLDLDGDLVPETMVAVNGPFAVDGNDHAAYEQWNEAQEYSLQDEPGPLDGQSMSMLLPFDAEAGYPDPFALPQADWCDCGVYDPMTAAPDWTVEGYASFNQAFPMPEMGNQAFPMPEMGNQAFPMPEMGNGFDDAGGYYEQMVPTAGYWDVDSYHANAGSYIDGESTVDDWDMPSGFQAQAFEPGGGYAYDASGYDATSGWDPTSGDASHEAFLSTITEDYSDPSSYSDGGWDLDTASDTSQFWMDEYNSASDTSWDLWNASVDASIAGDDTAAYDLNQASIAAESYSNDAWGYSNDAWSSSSYTDTSSSYTDTSSYSSGDDW